MQDRAHNVLTQVTLVLHSTGRSLHRGAVPRRPRALRGGSSRPGLESGLRGGRGPPADGEEVPGRGDGQRDGGRGGGVLVDEQHVDGPVDALQMDLVALLAVLHLGAEGRGYSEAGASRDTLWGPHPGTTVWGLLCGDQCPGSTHRLGDGDV